MACRLVLLALVVKDPHGNARHTGRQQAYKRRFALAYVDTPQIVVDGRLQAVGSRRSAITERAARARAAGRSGCALLLPTEGTGAIVGAAMLRLDGS